MTGPAVILMTIAIVLVWGGLVASIVALRFLPDAWDNPKIVSNEGHQAP